MGDAKRYYSYDTGWVCSSLLYSASNGNIRNRVWCWSHLQRYLWELSLRRCP